MDGRPHHPRREAPAPDPPKASARVADADPSVLSARHARPLGEGEEGASRVGSGAARPGVVRVEEVMERKVVRISADERLSTVEEIMTLGKVRHMPVVQAGRLVGVVSERDLLRASLSTLSEFGSEHRRAFLQGVEIRRVMSAPAIAADPELAVAEAAREMADRKIGCLPVVDPAGHLIGIVTETDLLRYFAARVEPVSRT